MHKFGEQDG